MPRVLVTGAAGFVGSHIAMGLFRAGMEVVSLDCLTYAGSLEALSKTPGLVNICHDIAEPLPLAQLGRVDFLVHNAAESHVDRSFSDPLSISRSNIIGTLNVLEAARELKPLKLVYTSTDEVFGPRTTPASESGALSPTNPYSASKAAGEMLVRAYHRSFGVPAVILRTVNMFGERQHCEKFVPRALRALLDGTTLDVHMSPDGEIGSRQWVHAGHQAERVWELLESGEPGSVHHLTGPTVSNLDLAQRLAALLGKKLDFRGVVSPRPFHDLHYFLGGRGPDSFEADLARTARWYAENRGWLQ